MVFVGTLGILQNVEVVFGNGKNELKGDAL